MTNSDKIKEALESCIVAEDRGMKLLHFDQAKVAEALKLLSSPAIVGVEPVAWIYEDTLPEGYPYDIMFPYSEVRDFVRMFPVFAPQAPQSSPAPVMSYAMSKDYDALYEHLKAGGEALGWDSSRHRTVYFLCREGERVCVRGEKYFKGFIESPLAFIAECTHLNLEWLAPAQVVMPQVDQIMEVVDVEPELPDDMPDEMWEACSSSREYMQEALRTVVRLTKEGIRSRLSALLKLPQ